MSADAFLDTNILVYATLTDDPRANTATTLVAERGVISVQVLNEFSAVAGRKLKRTWREIHTALDAFRALCPDIRPITLATHTEAVRIAERNGLSFYDALIVASALEAACTTLMTEDMQHGRLMAGRLLIHNPFSTA
jgi:predicted nucleic acid-binding protein